MKTTNVFKQNLLAYNKFKGSQTLIVNQGGQGSSKTISILQLLVMIAINSTKKLRITIASYALTHLRGGAMHDFEQILQDIGFNVASIRNKAESKYYVGKCEIEFVGIEGNIARATGPRRDILYVNEANKRITYTVFELMNARTALATFVDYNPSAEFWFHTEVVPNFEYELIKSTYLDNPYLPERERQNLLSKKDKIGYENWWKVYGLGELGQLEGAIFKNWRFGERSEFDNLLSFNHGLDFGYNDPDALVKVAVNKKLKRIHLHEKVSNGLIVADSQAKRTIKDLKLKGHNIIGAVKNRINDDIKALTGYELIVHPDSINTEKELNSYIWLDKKGGVPIDDFNHLMDAWRYAAMFVLKPRARSGMKAL
jgi:phage terminase large subunit